MQFVFKIVTTSVTTETTSTTSETTSSTTSTTSTTRPICNSTCGNDTTVGGGTVLARWDFENTFNDATLTHNVTPTNGPGFVLGYVGQALFLNSTLNQYLSTSYIPFPLGSFTIDTWIYPINFPNTKGVHSLVGQCPQQVAQQCLQFGLLSNSTSLTSEGYFGLWEAADLRGALPIRVNEWTHIAIVYARSRRRQSIYIDGIFDNSRANSSGFTTTNGIFYIGNNVDLTSNSLFGNNSYQVTILRNP